MKLNHWTLSAAVSMALMACSGAKQAGPTEPSPAPTDAGVVDEPAPHTDVIAFILSRCPHAAETMRSLLALKREMGSSMSLSVGYVGLVDGAGNIDPSVGEAEIAASRMQICVGVTADDTEWLEYLECVYEGERWRSMPDGFDECAERAEIDRDQVLDCIDSGDGDAILAQAYAAASGSRIVSSPTIIIGGQLYAGGSSVADLKQYICYVAGDESTRPALCDKVEPPPSVAATLLFDERCDNPRICDVSAEVSVLQKLIPGLTVVEKTFASEEGRKLYDLIGKTELGISELPIVIIDGALDRQAWVRNLFGEYLLPFGDGYVLALGRGWNPLAEICDNETDDNGNGKVDCDDASCAGTLVCREETPGRMDLFIMSQCPFGVQMMPVMDQVVSHFEKDRKAMDFRLQFIGDIDGDELTSMHGPEELAEDLRMACAQSLFGDEYQFMEYVLCRAKSPTDPAWETCVPKGMSQKKLNACATGDTGRKLLRESFALADTIGVTGSPTLILNSKTVLNVRDAESMVAGFCEKNDTPRCDTPVKAAPKAEPMPAQQCQ